MIPLHLQPESHVPLYIQLRDQIRALVHGGDLRPGERIPASRELATQLGVHRTTVANAYAELESEGLISGHVGRGTFIRGENVARKISAVPHPTSVDGGLRWESLFADERGEEILSRLTQAAPRGSISFVMARPAAEFFPIEELRKCSNAVWRREGTEILQFGPSDGYPPLKQALVAMLRAEGYEAGDENLLITDGCQQALDLVCKAFLRPGDTVLLENPAYPGALAVFTGARARILGVPVKTESGPGMIPGVDVSAIEAVLMQNRVKMMVLTPDFHNPTGTTLPVAERRRLLEIAARFQVPVIEDHIYARLRRPRGTRSVAEAARPFEHRHSDRQLFENCVSGNARGLDRGPFERNRSAAPGEAVHRFAHRPSCASHPGRIHASRTSRPSPRTYPQGLQRAPGCARTGARPPYAFRNKMDAS